MNDDEQESPKFRDFKEELKDKSQDWISIYIMALNEGLDYHAYLILESGKINLKNNNDPEMLLEVKGCIINQCNDLLETYITDGYIPSEQHLNDIMDFYSTLNEGSCDLSIFGHFNLLYRNLKIQNIKINLQFIQP